MTTDITVVVHNSEPIRVGGSVGGRFRAASESRLVVRRVAVRAKWQTGGSGEVRKGVGAEAPLPSFILEPGIPHEAAFLAELPMGPVTFAGQVISVTWYVEVELDIAWASNPRGWCEITVLAPVDDAPREFGYRHVAPLATVSTAALKSQSATTGLTRVLARTTMFLAPPALVAGLVLTQANPNAIFIAIVGALGTNFLLARSWFTSWRTERTFGRINISVEPAVVRRGGSVRVCASILPRRNLTIDGLDIWLRCVEYASRGSGQQATTPAHGDDIGFTALSRRRELTAGNEETFEGSLAVPEAALPTLDLENNTISWFAAVQVQANGQFATERVEIEVKA